MPDDLFQIAGVAGGLGAHPAANLFPMMTGPALDELMDDIKANGLINPITLDRDGRIIDGRNRHKACLLAGVEPRFESWDGSDALAFVVSLNVKRRNLTKPQLAIAAARAWAQAEAAGEVRPHGGDRTASDENRHLIQEPRKHFADLFGVSQDYARMARVVLAYSEPLTAQVSAGEVALEAAHSQATQADRAKKQDAETLVKLRRLAPDLVERIARDELKVNEANALFDARDAEFREMRRTVFHALLDATKTLSVLANTPAILDIPTIIEVPEFDTEFREFFRSGRQQAIDALKAYPEAVAVLKQLIAALEGRKTR
jgi:hypothetical protein